jgi:hypothetical protein
MRCRLRRILDKLLQEPGVAGYYVDGDTVTILVEDDEALATFSSLSFAGYRTQVRKIGRMQAL